MLQNAQRLTVSQSTQLERATKKSISQNLDSELKDFLIKVYNDFSLLEELAELDYDNPILIAIGKSRDAQQIVSNMFMLTKSDCLNLNDKQAYLKIERTERFYNEKLAFIQSCQIRFAVAMAEGRAPATEMGEE